MTDKKNQNCNDKNHDDKTDNDNEVEKSPYSGYINFPYSTWQPTASWVASDRDSTISLPGINDLSSFPYEALSSATVFTSSGGIASDSYALNIGDSSLDLQINLQTQINELQKSLSNTMAEASKAKKKSTKQETEIQQLKKNQDELKRKERLRHILSKVNEKARIRLLKDTDFQMLFESTDLCDAAVLAVDIRRSTDLMLKAKNATLYSEFISILCKGINEIVLSNYGVFDKFTGDGILAFFPDFFSGDDCLYLAMKSAQECHSFFEDCYRKNRNLFTTVILETGLGIGIDFGETNIVKIGNDLTAVGQNVVYACRFSSAPAGATLLNQRARDLAVEKYSTAVKMDESMIEVKHEGAVAAYLLSELSSKYNPKTPDWDMLIRRFKKTKEKT